MGLFDNGKTTEDARKHISDESADSVDTEDVRKIAELLDDDETVHYLATGSTIDVEGDSAGISLFGSDRSRKSGTTGLVRTAMTNKRVVVKIPQILGNDERSVPYQSLTSVDLDTGLFLKRISLQTPGQTYHIEAGTPSQEELRDAQQFIRDKLMESTDKPVSVEESAGTKPTEQLKRISELHEEGVLSDEEFTDKKSELLDEI